MVNGEWGMGNGEWGISQPSLVSREWTYLQANGLIATTNDA